MKNLTLWKALFAAAAITLSIPSAMAGGTNRGDNTSAQPGDNSATTVNPDTPNQQRDSTGTGTENSSSKSKHSRDRNRTSRTTGGDRDTTGGNSSDNMNNGSTGSSKPSGNSNGGY